METRENCISPCLIRIQGVENVVSMWDFIVRLKSGTICLFDTKTKGSDADAPEKNNALLDYISSYQSTGKKIVGGVLIKDEGTSNWYYPGGIIDNTDSIDGWSALHLETL